MAMGPERSKPPLHNFTLPCGLKWGNQKFLRCAKVDSNGEISGGVVHRRSYGSSEPSARRRVQPPAAAMAQPQRRGSNEPACVAKRAKVGETGRKFGSDVDNGIAAVREKLMFDLQKAADKMKDAIFREGLEDEERRRVVTVDVDVEEPPPPPPPAAAAEPELAPTTVIPSAGAGDSARPWNLRTRRSACKTAATGIPADGGGGSSRGLNIDVTKPNVSPSRTTDNKSPRLRSGSVGAATAGASSSGEKRDRAKFSVPLGKREIEEDFMAILGQRPPRRPKKRPKLVQRNLDTLFPGLWLSEITPDLYKVPDDHSK
nr:uncharacterized protein LOC109156702 [Ipomoea batatas]